MSDKSDTITAVCLALSEGVLEKASNRAKRDYPFAPVAVTKRDYGALESTRVFVRDGFLDRYTGERLIPPPVLRILSQVLPQEFPSHPTGKPNSRTPPTGNSGRPS